MSSIRPDAEARHPGIEELTPEMWDRFFAIFVRAPAILTRAALPLMRTRGFGRIVNNTTSYLTMLRVLPYGAAKAAFESMSAVWAKELEGSGITVNVLVPGGPTDTRADRRRIRLAARQDAAAGDHGRRRPPGSSPTHPPASPGNASRRRAGIRELAARRGRAAREPRHRLAGARR